MPAPFLFAAIAAWFLSSAALAAQGWTIEQKRHTTGGGHAATVEVTYRIAGSQMRIETRPEGMTDAATIWLLTDKGLFLCMKEPGPRPPDGLKPPANKVSRGICEKMAMYSGIGGTAGMAGVGVKAKIKKFAAKPLGTTRSVHGQPCQVYDTQVASAATVDVGGVTATSETQITATSCLSQAIDLKKVFSHVPQPSPDQILSIYADAATAQAVQSYHNQGIELESTGKAKAQSMVMNQRFENELQEALTTSSIKAGDIPASAFNVPAGYQIGKLAMLRALAAANNPKTPPPKFPVDKINDPNAATKKR